MAQTTVKPMLDVRNCKDTRFPIKIMVTFPVLVGTQTKFVQKFFRDKLSKKDRVTKEDFAKILKGELRMKELRDIRTRMMTDEKKAGDLLEEFPFITPELFAERWEGYKGRTIDTVELFDILIKGYREAGQASCTNKYTCARNALIKYIDPDAKEKAPVVPLQMISEEFLNEWKAAWKKDINTFMGYMECLRHVFNYAMDAKRRFISTDFYPFCRTSGGSGFVIYKVDNPQRKALPLDEKNKVLAYVPKTEEEKRALAFWRFSFFGNGMNPTDIAHAKQANIHEGEYSFRRQKNIRRRSPKLITFHMADDLFRTIEQYGGHSPYLFGIINDEMDAHKKRKAIHAWTCGINNVLKRIGQALELSVPLRMGMARHTTAATVLESGGDMRDVQEMLGHHLLATTEHYTKGKVSLQRSKRLISLLGLPETA